MFSSHASGRYDGEIERAFIRSMIDRANSSILANIIGLAVLGYACFALPFGATLALAVGGRVLAVCGTAFNTRELLAAIEADRPITGLVNRFALGMGFAGITWGGLVWAVPIGQLTTLGGLLVLTIILTGVSLVIATASPVPRVVTAFLAGFGGPMIAWLVAATGLLGFGPVMTISTIGFAVFSFSLGLTRDAQNSGRLIVDNRRLAEAHEKLIEELRLIAAEKEMLANRDSLTGLLNRRSFQFATEQIIDDGDRNQWSAILIDLDHFKAVNDQAGHAGGDEVLRATGQLLHALAEALPAKTIGARLGGEEFIVMVKGLRDSAVRDIAISIGARFRVIAPPEGLAGTISASMGIARWQPGETWEKCFARADAALYEAKAAGRDRTVCATDTPDLPYVQPASSRPLAPRAA